MTAHKHKEAFALMWYACRCGHRERFWNSRNGVTPFGGIRCPSCGEAGLDGGLYHIDFHLDAPDPLHKMVDGQQFFRDGTRSDAIDIIKRRIANYEKAGQPMKPQVAEMLLEDARTSPHPLGPKESWPSAKSTEFREGWPMSDRFDASRKDHREKYWGKS